MRVVGVLFIALLMTSCVAKESEVMNEPVAEAVAEAEDQVAAVFTMEGEPDRVIDIELGRAGFEPAELSLVKGEHTRLVFTRTAPTHCTSQIMIPHFEIGPVEIAVNDPMTIDVKPDEAGSFKFACGMDMMRGVMTVSS